MGLSKYFCVLLSALAFVNMAIGVWTISLGIKSIAYKYYSIDDRITLLHVPPEFVLVCGIFSFTTGSFCFYFARKISKCSFLTYIILAFICIILGAAYFIVGII